MKVDKHKKFLNLANKRMATAIKTIRLIGNLSNKNHYDYSPEEADMIIKSLRSELNDLIALYKISSSRKKSKDFTFDISESTLETNKINNHDGE